MKIIVLGVGNIGYNIAKHLVSSENEITIVDHDRSRLSEVSNILDVRPVFGYASHPSTLEQAGAEQADILIAVTNVDEVNLIACEVVHSLFDIETKIARVRQQNYFEDKYRLTLFQPNNISIDYLISPEIEIARSISKSIKINGTSDVADLCDQIKLISVRCLDSSPVINTPLRVLSNLYPLLSMCIVAIQRQEQTIIPNINDVITPNDQVYIVIKEQQAREVMAAFGYTEQARRRVTIAGCGNIGRTLGKEIEQALPDVQLKVIEKDPVCSELGSKLLKHAEILSGDALDSDILREAEIQHCDTFIAVTDDDNTNVMAALLAKYYGASRGISLLDDMQNAQFVTSLGVDSIVNQNAITVSTVLKAIRQHKVRSLYAIEGGVEVLEVCVSESSNIVGMSIEDIVMPNQVLIALLKRSDEVHVAPEKFIISVNDYLIFAVSKEMVNKVERLVSGRYI
ncbi:MAG: Trk system potassium transporter TrkA [Holosporales bacterium]|nr:Trk system potassium transporter TrkA [Holosporales bacterium]